MVLKQCTRKFDKLKVAFQETYLKFTCTDKVDVSVLKKKCGRIWACIEYAILEFVHISSFDCSHVERMQVKHNKYLLSRMCTTEGSEVEDKLMPNLNSLTPLLQFSIDDQAALVDPLATLPPRRSGREKPIPDPKLHQEEGKKQNDVCVRACVRACVRKCVCVSVCVSVCVCVLKLSMLTPV